MTLVDKLVERAREREKLVRGPHATKLETERARAREKLVRGPHATQLPLKPHLKSQFQVCVSEFRIG